jgi:hypothetical protein
MNSGDWVQLGALVLVSVVLILLLYLWIKGPLLAAIGLTIACLGAGFYITRKIRLF